MKINEIMTEDVEVIQPGATALFRIYVITATGNERGSNTVTITRPPAG